MTRRALALTLALLFIPMLAPKAKAITEEEAHAIGVDAYLYFYSLITMDLTRLQSTNVEPGQEPFRGPMNTLPSRAGCHSNTIPTARSISISRTRVRAQTRTRTGCRLQKNRST
jgi:hypothetical protein